MAVTVGRNLDRVERWVGPGARVGLVLREYSPDFLLLELNPEAWQRRGHLEVLVRMAMNLSHLRKAEE